MQRNWDLIREILTALEARETAHGGMASEQIPGYSPEVVSYHMYLLNEAHLIEARCLKSSNAPMHCIGLTLTWEGHEFLDSIRNDTVWKKVKSTVKSKGLDLSFEIVKQAANIIIKGVLGA